MTEPLIDPAKLAAERNFRAPDLVGHMEGWRAWNVSAQLPRFGTAPKLYSVTHSSYYWQPRKLSRAICSQDPSHVPGEKCGCGFYAAKDLDHLLTLGYSNYDAEASGQFCVVGQLAMWGKVIEGSQGWRAEKAYPVKLFVPFEAHYLAKPLSDAYGVPVQLRNILPASRYV
jgi:hypothetical protein